MGGSAFRLQVTEWQQIPPVKRDTIDGFVVVTVLA